MNKPIIQVKQITKNYGPTKALKAVDLDFYNGQIRGLVGENGSGKSTLASIIAGMQKQTSGQMLYFNESWEPLTMAYAQNNGIAMVLQEASTIDNSTVGENIFAGSMKQYTKFGIINTEKMNEAAKEILLRLNITHIKVEDNINKYNYEDRKLVEIARCLRDDIKLLILDETTTALSIEGRGLIYKIIENFKNENKSVIFISHDIDEILEHCTHVTVLRDGVISGHLDQSDLSSDDILKTIRYLMVGRDIGDQYYRSDFSNDKRSDEVSLEFENVTINDVKNISMKFYKGEIVGFGGLSGAGMHEIARAAFGLLNTTEGRIIRNNQEITTPNEAINLKMGYVSKNRDEEAIVLMGTIGENIILPSLPDIQQYGFISPKKEKKISNEQMDFYSIKAKNIKQRVDSLSGGNKQKVSFAKWTAKGSEFIIMDCPTRGVDVGVKQAMYQLMYDMKKEGKTILMISEELPELIGMSDRIIIMKNKEIVKEFNRSKDLTEHDIIEYMI